jgi:6-phosphogluconolactonase
MQSYKRSMFLYPVLIALVCYPPLYMFGGTHGSTGFVYVMTNNPNGNSVIQFSRASDGSLTKASQAATGGNGGTGNGVGTLDPLGSEDSLALGGSGSVLVAVNAGSGTLSALSVTSTGLHLLNTVSSGGAFPNSVAINGNLVYALNAHSRPPNISGFRLSSSGLTAISNSTVNLPGFTANSPNVGTDSPHDIRFTPDGTRLIVTEGGGSNLIDVFQLNNRGLVTATNSETSAGLNPFGMRFARAGVLLNAEADTNSVSSYSLSQGTLTVISPAVANGQAATCWISVTGDGKFGFTSNTGAGNLSSYQISGNGTLNLEEAIAATADGGNPIDSAFSSDSAFLYVEDTSMGRVLIYRVNGASLSLIGTVTGFPTTVQGIAAQ